MYSGDTGSHLQEHQACPRGDVCLCMCVTSPTNRKKKKKKKLWQQNQKKTKQNKKQTAWSLNPDVYLPSSSSSWRPKVHRLQVHKHKALLFFFLSRNVKIPLVRMWLDVTWTGSLPFPPGVILYMHNKPHKHKTRKQQSLTQIPGIIFSIYVCVIYMCVHVCVRVCVCVLWFGCQHILLFVSSNLAIYRDSLLFYSRNKWLLEEWA